MQGYLYQNPYWNPLIYGPPIAPRPSAPVWNRATERDAFVAQCYTPTGSTNDGLLFNTVPDVTLIGRPVFWTDYDRPDEVDDGGARCTTRFCY